MKNKIEEIVIDLEMTLIDPEEAISKLMSICVESNNFILNEMNKQINKYCEDHKHCNIITLDLDDVYTMLEKSKNKLSKI